MKNKLLTLYKSLKWKFYLVGLLFLSGGQLLADVTQPAGNSSASINNPIKSNSFLELLNAVLEIIVEIGTPIVIISIIFVGFKYVLAQGKPAEIQKAHSAITWVVVGAAIVIGAKVIVVIIQNTITGIKA